MGSVTVYFAKSSSIIGFYVVIKDFYVHPAKLIIVSVECAMLAINSAKVIMFDWSAN